MQVPPSNAIELYKCEVCGRVIGGLDENGDGWWSIWGWEQCKHYTMKSCALNQAESPFAKSSAKAAAHTWRDSKNVYFAIKVQGHTGRRLGAEDLADQDPIRRGIAKSSPKREKPIRRGIPED